MLVLQRKEENKVNVVDLVLCKMAFISPEEEGACVYVEYKFILLP